MEKGFREILHTVSQNRWLKNRPDCFERASMPLAINLLGSKKPTEEEIFNGFKDELTDYSKYKGRDFRCRV